MKNFIFVLLALNYLVSTATFAADVTNQENRLKNAEQNFMIAKSNYENATAYFKAQQERVSIEKQILKKREKELAKAKIEMNRTISYLKIEENRVKTIRIKNK